MAKLDWENSYTKGPLRELSLLYKKFEGKLHQTSLKRAKLTLQKIRGKILVEFCRINKHIAWKLR